MGRLGFQHLWSGGCDGQTLRVPEASEAVGWAGGEVAGIGWSQTSRAEMAPAQDSQRRCCKEGEVSKLSLENGSISGTQLFCPKSQGTNGCWATRAPQPWNLI